MAAETGASAVLSFLPMAPAPDVGFWQELTRLKLDVLRLDSSALPVHAYYEAPTAPNAPPKCFLLRGSFDEDPSFQAGGALIRGQLKNFNTVEEFRRFLSGPDRLACVTEKASQLRDDIISGIALSDPVKLRPLLIFSFADLKHYDYVHTMAFPVLSPPTPWKLFQKSCEAHKAGFSRELLSRLSKDLHDDPVLASAGVFLLLKECDDWITQPLAALGSTESVIVFVDPSTDENAPGWPLRNILLALAHHQPGQRRILAFRDPHLFSRSEETPTRSRVFYVDACAKSSAETLVAPLPTGVALAGWSKIHKFDLTSFLDKRHMAAAAVDLNIKLMKWRLLPNLEPERMKTLRCLLLGAGTLGCSIARALAGWGVRHITFVDSGKVSLSNPVRQSLFTHQDAAMGRPKVKAACEALQAVLPDAIVEGVEMEIPMPGHPNQKSEELKLLFNKLRELVATHDVIFMLTDSRESRWLPSLLVAAKQQQSGDDMPPLGLTVALGFDSFLVMRQTYLDSPSACYFCNDVNPPSDSLAFRTLDQQCTVTRPGLAGIASGIAVELLAALVQHRDRFRACCKMPLKSDGHASADLSISVSPLGAVPHVVRGFLSDFFLAPAETEPFPQCICCSKAVLSRYASEGDALLERIVTNSSELEEISGLKAMKEAVHEDDVLSFDDFQD